MSSQIVKLIETETAHIVRNAVSERCRFNIHGHSYKWEICIKGPINPETGMVLDFKELADIKAQIDKFDHATTFWSKEDPMIINFFKDSFHRVVVMEKNVTAENMARWAHKMTTDWLATNKNPSAMVAPTYTCAYVRVWETRTGSAWTDESDWQDTLVYCHEEL